MWYEERVGIDKFTGAPIFTLCCRNGIVELPFLQDPPQLISDLLFKRHPYSKHFLENIRGYNTMFSFTSMGGKIDTNINRGRGPYTFRMGGQNVHLIGGLVPGEHESPKFAQLYIYDTHDEVNNRKYAIRYTLSFRFLYTFRVINHYVYRC